MVRSVTALLRTVYAKSTELACRVPAPARAVEPGGAADTSAPSACWNRTWPETGGKSLRSYRPPSLQRSSVRILDPSRATTAMLPSMIAASRSASSVGSQSTTKGSSSLPGPTPETPCESGVEGGGACTVQAAARSADPRTMPRVRKPLAREARIRRILPGERRSATRGIPRGEGRTETAPGAPQPNDFTSARASTMLSSMEQ